MAIDLSTVPLVTANVASRQAIAILLNPMKCLPSDNGLPRDWRGLAHLLEFNGEVVSLLTSHSDPTTHIFTILEKNQKDISIKGFQTMMEQMDRWDVIDDTEVLLQKDAERYLEHQQRAQVSADPIDEGDREILTLGDVYRLKQGLGTQYYDAFLLYADEDIDFVNEMIDKLETEYKLKLCLKDRDLVAGTEFEHEAVMKLITERCNRLLIIVTPNFLNSSANKFFLNYTQALSIEKQQRKIIPCIYKNCELPVQLKYIFKLDYNRKGFFDFWGKVRDSVKAPNFDAISTARIGNSSNITQETIEVKDILPNKHSDLYSVTQKVNEETSKYSQHENCENYKSEAIAKVSDTKTLNVSSKKNKTLLRWDKITSNWKTKQTKQCDQLTTEEIIENLPSINNLDSLDLSSSTHMFENKKKNLFSKFTKKKKIALKT
ncbi:myeloid differentiation primary response protein MyD88 isoform X2 [Pogonomyrmex barbatus]|uniref:Myeloid differentiation primary response protein MyD88 isoform X2 n=1 Tax=Pogonomyrmex barbatus TaxID=144034 RepID=A0A6I9X3A9_9HYME|nr:myeloid differentiation primary response protein MyD88 isoform X2 [Pogonomyrmex barbatus]